jgi:hypothetical protein
LRCEVQVGYLDSAESSGIAETAGQRACVGSVEQGYAMNEALPVIVRLPLPGIIGMYAPDATTVKLGLSGDGN